MEALDQVFAGSREGYVYARYGSPTVTALEEAVATLENGEAALAFASGMAAIHAALLAVGTRAGSAVVAARDIYGATYALLDQLMRTQGVTVRFVDATDLDAVEAACADLQPVALLVETISNPLLKVADLPRLADIAHRHSTAFLSCSPSRTWRRRRDPQRDEVPGWSRRRTGRCRGNLRCNARGPVRGAQSDWR
jgi:cystathionine gamma-synthase/methionine-gamma-lyase